MSFTMNNRQTYEMHVHCSILFNPTKHMKRDAHRYTTTAVSFSIIIQLRSECVKTEDISLPSANTQC